MQVAKSVQHVANTADDVAQSFFFEVDLTSEGLFQSGSFLIEAGVCAR